jgi:hypothetical protein
MKQALASLDAFMEEVSRIPEPASDLSPDEEPVCEPVLLESEA